MTHENFANSSTTELIALLDREEDRVSLELIQELARRPDAIEPLREILADEIYWGNNPKSNSWAPYHAFTILALTGDAAHTDDLLEALDKATVTDFDYLAEISPAALAQAGVAAVPPLKQFVVDLKDQHELDWKVTYPRSHVVTALARIAFEHESVRQDVADFVCSLLEDPSENDDKFLAFICDDAILLDPERGLAAVKAAYERNMIDKFVYGDFNDFLTFIKESKGEKEWKFTQDLLEFYRPEEIDRRQERWKREREEDEQSEAKRVAQINEGEAILHRLSRPSNIDMTPVAPSGFSKTDDGNFVHEAKVGRNDPCPCGSGKKYKKCCGK